MGDYHHKGNNMKIEQISNHINRILVFLFSLAMAIFSFVNNVQADSKSLILSLPIDCLPNYTCFIQNYVDIDPTKQARDYACSSSTYDGHKGVDFRLLSTKASSDGVNVLAAAAGVIKARRDGLVDRLIIDINDPSIQNQECGNGVVIEHGNGWETQYCHMRQGSVLSKIGDRVTQGQVIGKVGYSGLAQFAHLHISVRHDGKIIDPFTATGVDNSCNASPNIKAGLWDNSVREVFIYKNGALIESGFATTPVKSVDLEAGNKPAIPTSISASAIVIYARFINLKKGDKISFEIIGPAGEIISNTTKPLQRNKAQYVAYSGKKQPKESWQQGVYKAQIKLIRENEIIMQKENKVELF